MLAEFTVDLCCSNLMFPSPVTTMQVPFCPMVGSEVYSSEVKKTRGADGKFP